MHERLFLLPLYHKLNRRKFVLKSVMDSLRVVENKVRHKVAVENIRIHEI